MSEACLRLEGHVERLVLMFRLHGLRTLLLLTGERHAALELRSSTIFSSESVMI